MPNLPDDYKTLQKLAGAVEEASGKGTTEEIEESLQEAPQEQVEEAKQEIGLEEAEDPEKEEDSSSKEKENSKEEKTDVEEASEDEKPELQYTSSRDQDGDLFGRGKTEEEVLEKAEEEQEEEQEDTEDEEDGKTDVEEAEQYEIDLDVLRYPHIIVNKGLQVLLKRKFGVHVPELSEEELEELSKNTELVAEEKLSPMQKRRLQSQSGIFGIIVGHGKKVLEAWVTDSEDTEEADEKEEEQPEHLQNDLDSRNEEDDEEGKFDGVEWN